MTTAEGRLDLGEKKTTIKKKGKNSIVAFTPALSGTNLAALLITVQKNRDLATQEERHVPTVVHDQRRA